MYSFMNSNDYGNKFDPKRFDKIAFQKKIAYNNFDADKVWKWALAEGDQSLELAFLLAAHGPGPLSKQKAEKHSGIAPLVETLERARRQGIKPSMILNVFCPIIFSGCTNYVFDGDNYYAQINPIIKNDSKLPQSFYVAGLAGMFVGSPQEEEYFVFYCAHSAIINRRQYRSNPESLDIIISNTANFWNLSARNPPPFMCSANYTSVERNIMNISSRSISEPLKRLMVDVLESAGSVNLRSQNQY